MSHQEDIVPDAALSAPTTSVPTADAVPSGNTPMKSRNPNDPLRWFICLIDNRNRTKILKFHPQESLGNITKKIAKKFGVEDQLDEEHALLYLISGGGDKGLHLIDEVEEVEFDEKVALDPTGNYIRDQQQQTESTQDSGEVSILEAPVDASPQRTKSSTKRGFRSRQSARASWDSDEDESCATGSSVPTTKITRKKQSTGKNRNESRSRGKGSARAYQRTSSNTPTKHSTTKIHTNWDSTRSGHSSEEESTDYDYEPPGRKRRHQSKTNRHQSKRIAGQSKPLTVDSDDSMDDETVPARITRSKRRQSTHRKQCTRQAPTSEESGNHQPQQRRPTGAYDKSSSKKKPAAPDDSSRPITITRRTADTTSDAETVRSIRSSTRRSPRRSRQTTTQYDGEVTVITKRVATRKNSPKRAPNVSRQLSDGGPVDDDENDDDDDVVETEPPPCTEDPYPVGSFHFIYDECFGYSFPVQVIKPPKSEKIRAKKNERCIAWIGYHYSIEVVPVARLEEFTDEREYAWRTVTEPALKQQARQREAAEKKNPSPPKARAKEDKMEDVQVGSRCFVNTPDGDYPATVTKLCPKATDKCIITFVGYSKAPKRVLKADLLKATDTREMIYEVRQKYSEKQNELEAKRRRKRGGVAEQEPPAKRPMRGSPTATSKLGTKRNNKKDSDDSSVADGVDTETRLYGPATSVENLPTVFMTRLVPNGTLQRQRNRLIYFARDDERPLCIAEKFQIPVGKIMYDNRRVWPQLKTSSRLKKNTPVVLPRMWNGRDVFLCKIGRTNNRQASSGRDERMATPISKTKKRKASNGRDERVGTPISTTKKRNASRGNSMAATSAASPRANKSTESPRRFGKASMVLEVDGADSALDGQELSLVNSSSSTTDEDTKKDEGDKNLQDEVASSAGGSTTTDDDEKEDDDDQNTHPDAASTTGGSTTTEDDEKEVDGDQDLQPGTGGIATTEDEKEVDGDQVVQPVVASTTGGIATADDDEKEDKGDQVVQPVVASTTGGIATADDNEKEDQDLQPFVSTTDGIATADDDEKEVDGDQDLQPVVASTTNGIATADDDEKEDECDQDFQPRGPSAISGGSTMSDDDDDNNNNEKSHHENESLSDDPNNTNEPAQDDTSADVPGDNTGARSEGSTTACGSNKSGCDPNDTTKPAKDDTGAIVTGETSAIVTGDNRIASQEQDKDQDEEKTSAVDPGDKMSADQEREEDHKDVVSHVTSSSSDTEHENDSRKKHSNSGQQNRDGDETISDNRPVNSGDGTTRSNSPVNSGDGGEQTQQGHPDDGSDNVPSKGSQNSTGSDWERLDRTSVLGDFDDDAFLPTTQDVS
ncbi:expressed unknown protein [Seminavis robusta]|uniref:Uncharacterized protein n=1 Tax=Seminavis robusta TaxID=568900 RepID=A0A9N8DMU2_9STRA|nr:expressed unknown protein [Seminavis robusta]|eukprot:Sro234_g094560.1 n/a (1336) ;mRNA; f:77709-81716